MVSIVNKSAKLRFLYLYHAHWKKYNPKAIRAARVSSTEYYSSYIQSAPLTIPIVACWAFGTMATTKRVVVVRVLASTALAVLQKLQMVS
jgi:hypothetical protein